MISQIFLKTKENFILPIIQGQLTPPSNMWHILFYSPTLQGNNYLSQTVLQQLQMKGMRTSFKCSFSPISQEMFDAAAAQYTARGEIPVSLYGASQIHHFLMNIEKLDQNGNLFIVVPNPSDEVAESLAQFCCDALDLPRINKSVRNNHITKTLNRFLALEKPRAKQDTQAQKPTSGPF